MFIELGDGLLDFDGFVLLHLIEPLSCWGALLLRRWLQLGRRCRRRLAWAGLIYVL